MIKVKYLSFSFLFFISYQCFSQSFSNIQIFEKEYNQQILKTKSIDSTIYIYSILKNKITDLTPGFTITALDLNLNIKWSKNYFTKISSFSPAITDFNFTDDGGLILTGTEYDTNVKDSILLLKLDSFGNVEWSKTYAPTNNQNSIKGFLVYQDNLLNYNIYGAYDDMDIHDWKILYLKTDNVGQIIDENLLSGNFSNIINYSLISGSQKGANALIPIFKYPNRFSICEIGDSIGVKYSHNSFELYQGSEKKILKLRDGTILFFSDFYNPNSLMNTISISMLDSNLATIWSKMFFSLEDIFIRDIVEVEPTKLLVCGLTNATNSNLKHDSFIFSIDNNGNILWSKKYLSNYTSLGHNNIFNSLVIANEKIFVFGGANYGPKLFGNFVGLEIDSTGESNCDNQLFQLNSVPSPYFLNQLTLNSDSILLSNNLGSINYEENLDSITHDCFVYITENDSSLNLSEPKISTLFSNEIKIDFGKLNFTSFDYMIFDTKGALVRNGIADKNFQSIPTAELARGLYIMIINTNLNNFVYRLIKTY